MKNKSKDILILGGALLLGGLAVHSIHLASRLNDEEEINELQQETLLKLENTLNKIEG